MGELIGLPTFSDSRGELTVIEKGIGFDIKRVYYIYNSDGKKRGFHKHKKTHQALIALSGSCRITINDQNNSSEFILDKPFMCLIIRPEEFHWMDSFSKDCILLVLASEKYNPDDYIYET